MERPTLRNNLSDRLSQPLTLSVPKFKIPDAEAIALRPMYELFEQGRVSEEDLTGAGGGWAKDSDDKTYAQLLNADG